METELNAMQRPGFIKDDPDLLFTFLRSSPARPAIETKGGFNWKAGIL